MQRPAVGALAHLEGMHAIEPGAMRISPIRVLVRERRRIAAGVPFLAVDRAGVAADAGVEIDDSPRFTVFAVQQQVGAGEGAADDGAAEGAVRRVATAANDEEEPDREARKALDDAELTPDEVRCVPC